MEQEAIAQAATGAAVFLIFVSLAAVVLALAILYALDLTRKNKHLTAELTVTKEWHRAP